MMARYVDKIRKLDKAISLIDEIAMDLPVGSATSNNLYQAAMRLRGIGFAMRQALSRKSPPPVPSSADKSGVEVILEALSTPIK